MCKIPTIRLPVAYKFWRTQCKHIVAENLWVTDNQVVQLHILEIHILKNKYVLNIKLKYGFTLFRVWLVLLFKRPIFEGQYPIFSFLFN
jgi:hypothetical protein